MVSWAAGECPACAIPGTRWELLATGEQTGGSYAVVEITADPAQGLPLHSHAAREAFYVLEGRFELVIGDQRVICGTGGFATIPPAQPHRWRNVGQSQGRLLCFIVPGGLEGFFRQIGQPVPGRRALPPTLETEPEAVPGDVAARFGIELLE